MKTRILIIDDHFAQRLGLTVAISHESDLEVVGQGDSVAVATRQTYFPSVMVSKIEARLKRDPLTPRELEILGLIVEGLSNKEIGSRLDITEGTVKLHVSKVLAKIGAQDRTRAALLAIERGIVRF